jgi:serine/threonine protein kinase
LSSAPARRIFGDLERFGKYLLMKQIAEGGMGEVFLARQRGLADVERMVVLKRIRPSLRDDDKFETLFLSEARITARLNHPNVVQLYEFGRIDESYFLTFEQIRGFDLAHLRKRRPEPWPLDATLELASQALAGLSHVHGLRDFDGRPLGIVHRDVSPPNVMISTEGTTKLLDFGVARSSSDPRDPDRMVHGKFPYLSPEQCNFDQLDGRSDIFSLGAVLYELLTGQVTFARPTRQETMAAILLRDPAAPSTLRQGGLPPVIDELCQRALKKSRQERFQTAEAMQAEVEQIAQTLGLARGPRVLTRFIESLDAEKQTGDVPRPPSVVTETVVRNLLLVDDDEENLQALRRTFRSAYNLFFSSDPREALKIVEDNVIHVVVSDQRMPGMTGVELLQLAGATRPGLLKVITSALSDSGTLLSAINVAGIHRYVVKPWQPEELRRVVDDLVSEKAGTLQAESQKARQSEKENFSDGDTAQRGAPKLKPADKNTDELRVGPKGDKPAGERAGGERTVVDEMPPSRTRQRLRPELIRLFEATGHAALVLMGLPRPRAEDADRLVTALEPDLGGEDVVVRVSDEKIAIVLGADSEKQARTKVSALHERVAVHRGAARIPESAMVATYLPEDAADPDEALMRASTALVIAKKQQKGA